MVRSGKMGVVRITCFGMPSCTEPKLCCRFRNVSWHFFFFNIKVNVRLARNKIKLNKQVRLYLKTSRGPEVLKARILWKYVTVHWGDGSLAVEVPLSKLVPPEHTAPRELFMPAHCFYTEWVPCKGQISLCHCVLCSQWQMKKKKKECSQKVNGLCCLFIRYMFTFDQFIKM